jgi:hypothetical protein
MLLKAALNEKGERLFDPRTGRSIGYSKCVNLSIEKLGLPAASAGTLRVIDALRDDEQHYIGGIDEGVLYLHMRAAVTLFDDMLQSQFDAKLADYLPARILPISTEAPADFDLLIDSEYSQVKEMLQPDRRRRAEARGKIRTLLAMEAHIAEDVAISEKDVDRVETAVRSGRARDEVFPRLSGLATTVEGLGATITVRFSKKEGAPVRFVAADDPTAAGAVRELDLQRKYRYSRKELAERLGLTTRNCLKLRRHLEIDTDPSCIHEFIFGATKHLMFSDEALSTMKRAIEDGIDFQKLV